MQNNKARFFYVLYSDKTWVFYQSECTQGPIYTINTIYSVRVYTYYNIPANFFWDIGVRFLSWEC